MPPQPKFFSLSHISQKTIMSSTNATFAQYFGAEIIEVRIIRIENQRKSVEKKDILRKKVNKSGRPYATYNHGPHLSKTNQRQV